MTFFASPFIQLSFFGEREKKKATFLRRGRNSDFFLNFKIFFRHFPLAALLSQGDPSGIPEALHPPTGALAEDFNSNNAAKTFTQVLFQKVYFFNSLFPPPFIFSPLTVEVFFSLFWAPSEVFTLIFSVFM